MPTPCPVCGYRLPAAPWTAEKPSYDTCPSCGITFGAEDIDDNDRRDVRAYRRWRERWVADGMPWSSPILAPAAGWQEARVERLSGAGVVRSVPNGGFSDLGFDCDYTIDVSSDGKFRVEPLGVTVFEAEGGTGFSGAAPTDDLATVIISSGGQTVLLNVHTEIKVRVAMMAYGIWGVPTQGVVIINNHDHLIGIAGGQVIWTTRPISMCSDFERLSASGHFLAGEAEGPDKMYPFTVDLLTGEVEGGWRVP